MTGTNKKPLLPQMVKLNFDKKGRVVFYIEGHGRFGLRADQQTDVLREDLEAAYDKAISLEVEL